MQLLLLLVQLEAHRVVIFTESSVCESSIELRRSRKYIFFHKIINGVLPLYLQWYTSFLRWCSLSNKMSKSKEDKIIFCENNTNHLFFLTLLKHEIISGRTVGIMNHYLHLKQKFSVRQDQEKLDFWYSWHRQYQVALSCLKLNFSHFCHVTLSQKQHSTTNVTTFFTLLLWL